MSLTDTRDLRDRTDAGWRPAPELVLREIGPNDGTLFVTEPFDGPVDLAGLLRGELDFTINRYDVDLRLTLYELTADGEFIKLFEPAFAFRASYARDRIRRHLLLNGVRQQLPFQSSQMVGRRLPAGSRQPAALSNFALLGGRGRRSTDGPFRTARGRIRPTSRDSRGPSERAPHADDSRVLLRQAQRDERTRQRSRTCPLGT